MPVTAEHWACVGGEHSLIAVRTSDVPQLYITILKGCSESKIILHAKLNISHTFRLTCEK